MKIAITGEGKTDFGQKEYSTGKWLPGPAIVYAENIAKEKGVEVEFIPIEKEDVKKVKLQRRSSKEVSGRGIPARKFRWVKESMMPEYFIVMQIKRQE